MKILFIDDESLIHEFADHLFSDCRVDVLHASTGAEGLEVLKAEENNVLLVVLDFELPNLAGNFICRRIKKEYPNLPVIIFSGRMNEERAQACHAAGADALIEKGEAKRIKSVILGWLQKLVTPEKTQSLNQKRISNILNMAGVSGHMLNVASTVDVYAKSKETVLILGENGTGKEGIALALHNRSGRRGRYVPVNCGGVSDSLFESQFFGHIKGAFTGSDKDHDGFFKAAERGTLFLDEVGELSLENQAKLLRALETGDIMPVGSHKIIRPEVRVVAATNRNLEEAIQEGKFREDLYYRLYVLPLNLFPLRERPEDIPILTQHFLDQLNKEYDADPPKKITQSAIKLLSQKAWPGNVRSLRNKIMGAFTLARDREYINEDFFQFSEGEERVLEVKRLIEQEKFPKFSELLGITEELKTQLISKALGKMKSYKDAADALGVDRHNLRKEAIKRNLTHLVDTNKKQREDYYE